jgi:hypothetical protein
MATVNICTLSVQNGLTVGQFLEQPGSVFLTCAAGSGGVPVTLTSNSPFLQLAVNATDPGSNSITVTVPSGSHTASYWVYGLGTGLATGEGASPQTVTYTATSATNGSGVDTVTLAPSAILLSQPNGSFGGSFSASVAAGAQTFSVVTDVLTNDGLNNPTIDGLNQPLAGNAGNNPLLVTIVNSNSSAGSVSTTSVPIAPGTSGGTGTFTFTPKAANLNTTLSVTQPAAWVGSVGPLYGDVTQVAITTAP